MRTELSWIEGPWRGRLAILPRPRGGDGLEGEIRGWRTAGLNAVVSLLADDEVNDLDLAQEPNLCQANDIRFLSHRIVDYGVPDCPENTLDFVKNLEARLAGGENVAVHCRGGIGRSALIAACLLVLAGANPEVAFGKISAARGCSVPETLDQQQWVIKFARNLTPGSVRG